MKYTSIKLKLFIHHSSFMITIIIYNNDDNDAKVDLIQMYETPVGYFMAFQRLWKGRYQQ